VSELAISGAEPVLSAVVVIVSDTLKPRANAGHLAGCLGALRQQIDAPPFEIIVPYHAATDGIVELQKDFVEVRFVAVQDAAIGERKPGSREHHDVLRSRGLAVARGALLALLEDHARPDPRWCANLAAAHRQSDAAAVGGAIENGVDRPLAWAVYYCDFARYQNPVPDGASQFASDANTAYKRHALESIRSLWHESFKEGVVNGALLAAGKTLVLRGDAIVYQHRSDLTLADAQRERFVWARSYARTRATLLTPLKRLAYAVASPLLPPLLLLRMASTAWKRRRHFGKFVGAAPLAALLLCGWSAGECAGYVAAMSDRH
jgi:hypothetical protein